MIWDKVVQDLVEANVPESRKGSAKALRREALSSSEAGGSRPGRAWRMEAFERGKRGCWGAWE